MPTYIRWNYVKEPIKATFRPPDREENTLLTPKQQRIVRRFIESDRLTKYDAGYVFNCHPSGLDRYRDPSNVGTHLNHNFHLTDEN